MTKKINKKIMQSHTFLTLPASARCLYIYLVLDADNDGIVEAGHVLSLTGATVDDLNQLIAYGYIRRMALDDTLVIITDKEE